MKHIKSNSKLLSFILLLLATLVGCGAPIDAGPVELNVSICCEIDGVYSFQLAKDCKKQGGLSAPIDQCQEEEVCCMNADGTTSTVPSSECNDANIVSDDECSDEVCCRLDDGSVMTLPAADCDTTDILLPQMCDIDVCCVDADGAVSTVPQSECDAANIVADEQCAQEICCRLEDGSIVTLPATDCLPINILPTQMCEQDVCCMNADGTTSTIPMSECDPTNVVADDLCLAEDVCCKTADGNQTVPADECEPSQIQPAEMCVDDVCCQTATGTQTVPETECDPANIVSADQCEQKECVKFRAVDMGSLPYTTTSGDTLASVATLGIYPAASSWGAPCLDVPAGTDRAFAAVGSDAVLTFSSPVSSLYILRFHGQMGDDLTIPGSVLSPTFCAANAYNDVTEVTLNAPSTTVTVQDVNPNGGSGYSVLLAECIEWATE